MLRISQKTLERRVKDGTLPVFRIGRRTLFSAEDLLRYVQSSRWQAEDYPAEGGGAS